MSELRYDLIHDEYILIAPERLHRPIASKEEPTPPQTICPFCPGNENLSPKEIYAIYEDSHWQTRVVPNRYKALQIETPFYSKRDGINEVWGGFGAHEIIIDTPKHQAKLHNMSQEEIILWLKTIQKRTIDLEKDKRLIQIECFKNYGLSAGASQAHPHTQILALPLITKARQRVLLHTHRYYQEHGRSLFEDIIEFERNSKDRFLKEDKSFFTYSPYASAFPFETIIISKRASSFKDLDNSDLEELAITILSLFKALNKELGDFAYNLLFMLPPLNRNFENSSFFDDLDRSFRFHIRITPRLYKLAGFELMSGSAINPVSPELVSQLLRKKYETSS